MRPCNPTTCSEPDRAARWIRALTALVVGLLIAGAGLLDSAATHQASVSSRAVAPADTDSTTRSSPPSAPADSDSVATAVPDSSAADTLGTRRVERYLQPLRSCRRSSRSSAADVTPRRRSPLLPMPRSWQHQVQMDSTDRAYVAREQVGEHLVRDPLRLDFDAYRQERLKTGLQSNWQELVAQHERQRRRESGSGGLGLNIDVPGGRQSAFSTVFGKDEIDLRVNGQAEITAGFRYHRSDQQVSLTGSASQVDPNFEQTLRLGITGSIGDKLNVNVNWDTQSQFDYQNQIELKYQGYEDEILQNVEAGNVFLQTPSTLIQGGQKLFGIKSALQVGGVRLTTVASQQEGQSNSLNIEGGAKEDEFELRPTAYDERTHYFLGYAFRNNWEQALSDPTTLRLPPNFERITNIEVWVLQNTTSTEESRPAVAMVDLGESKDILTQADAYTAVALPDPENDQYSEADIDQNLVPNGPSDPNPTAFLEERGLDGSVDYQTGDFKKLDPNRDYTLHEELGYLSLNSSIQDSKALAVAFQYKTRDGQLREVGDVSPSGSNNTANEDRIVLKLLRPSNLTAPSNEEGGLNPAAWYLEMRNIYSLQGRSFNPDNFELDIMYTPSSSPPQKQLPDVQGRTSLLRLLGLDRLNTNQQSKPDGEFDFLRGATIDQENGLLIFPYLEPFGQRLREVIEDDDGGPELIDSYVFSGLYRNKKSLAEENDKDKIYRIRGSHKGAQQSFYDLQAFSGLVDGSVRVTSDGTPLQEGTDYVVNYQSGTVNITNQTYLAAGRDLNITYEQNSLFNTQKKTLLGARADYSLADKLQVGATAMRLSQNSPVDKFRIGEEPVSNFIIGMDGSLDLQPRWLTWAVDALPFVQTKSESSIQVTGEVAQLRPGHGETTAYERSRSNLQDRNLDFKPDERNGISYIDDFEGFENTFSLKRAGTWRLSSTPVFSLEGGDDPEDVIGLTDDSLRSNRRASLGWYQLNQNSLEQITEDGAPAPTYPEAIERVPIQTVFPERETGGRSRYLETFDLYFDPHRRGPYNYTRDLQDFLSNPKENWGGITLSLQESGYTDFEERNVEFVEFVFRPFSENQENDAGKDAKLYFDLGSISEDIVPNGELNNEDGLKLVDLDSTKIPAWGRTPNGQQENSLDTREESPVRTEDLGLDGLASYDNAAYPARLTESGHFSDFLSTLPACSSARCEAEVARAQRDPSGDDYHNFGEGGYFNNETLFPGGATVQQRFAHFFAGQELNGYEPQSELGGSNGNSRYPDSEDLNRNSTIDTENNYYEYGVPLGKDELDRLASNNDPTDYVVGEIKNGDQGTGWYVVRIPVRNPGRTIGRTQTYSLIESLRFWTTGHRAPVTLRFATMELVGSRWRASPEVAMEKQSSADTSDTRLTISSVNNEENSEYAVPNGTVRKQQIDPTGGAARQTREQSLVLRAQRLKPNQQRGIFKTFTQGLDLLKYRHLRMFAHMDGELQDGTDLSTLPRDSARSKIRLFVRLGSNETDDYYEYEQPLSPSSLEASTPSDLWQTNQTWEGQTIDLNSVNIRTSAFNRLKFERNESEARRDRIFWNVQGEGQEEETLVPVDAIAFPQEGFAPPGTRIGIKGNPSLGDINTIVIGLRNPADSTSLIARDILKRVDVWVNELRVSGYDQSNGWAAIGNTDIQLADFGEIRGSFRQRTSGFGSLSSTLADRDRTRRNNWSIQTNLNLDKFIPERYGWRLPVTLKLNSETSTPEFAPSRGDIRVSSIMEQKETEAAKQQALRAAQTHSMDRSMTMRLSKQNSEAPFLQKTLDGLQLSYSYQDRNARDPSLQLNDSWSWNSSASYKFNAEPHTFNPFGFLGDVPVLGILGDLAWNYVPNSINLSGRASRRFTAEKDRPQPDAQLTLPPNVRYDLQDNHNFNHNRNFSLQYNPFNFLNLGFDLNTKQDLNQAGVDTSFSVVVADSANPSQTIKTLHNSRLTENLEEELEKNDQIGFENDSLRVRPTNRVLSNLYAGAASPYTDRHGQEFVATFRPQLSSSEWLNWISLQDVTYRISYDWQNSPPDRQQGANISNQIDLNAGITLNPQTLFRKFDWYTALEEEQEQSKSQEEEEPQQQTPQAAPPDSVQADSVSVTRAEGEQEKDDTSGLGVLSALDVSLPSARDVFRQVVLTLTGIQDVNVTYSGSRGSRVNNVGYASDDGSTITDVSSGYGLWDAFGGAAVPAGYRFGLDRRIDKSFRVRNPNLQIEDVLNDGNSIRARTTLNPSSNLQVNLNWNTEWNQQHNITYNCAQDNPGPQCDPGKFTPTPTDNGSNSASVWAFGGSYLDVFKQQLETYRQDFRPEADTLGDANNDGRVAFTDESVLDDFLGAFTRGLGTVDQRGLLPFPMPGWSINYSGLSDWPLLGRLTQRVTLEHTYQADYRTSYRSVLGEEEDEFTLGEQTLITEAPDFRASAVTINEGYRPLIGLNVTWKGRIQTDIDWNRNNSYSLNPSGKTISEDKTSEVTLSASYRQEGLNIPFLPIEKLDNTIRFNLDASYSTHNQHRYILKSALSAAIANGVATYNPQDALQGDLVSVLTEQSRVSVTPTISYQFSDRVSGDFSLQIDHLNSADSRLPSSTDINGGFNVRVSISN